MDSPTTPRDVSVPVDADLTGDLRARVQQQQSSRRGLRLAAYALGAAALVAGSTVGVLHATGNLQNNSASEAGAADGASAATSASYVKVPECDYSQFATCFDLPPECGSCYEAQLETGHDPEDPIIYDFNVFTPAPAKAAKISRFDKLPYTPLIFMMHGFGGAKYDLLTSYSVFETTTRTASRMWLDEGYTVISFSFRGFGASKRITGDPFANYFDSGIGMMDPALDGQDMLDLVDWSINHIREGFVYDPSDPTHRDPYFRMPGKSLLRADAGRRLVDDVPVGSNGPLDRNPQNPKMNLAYGTTGFSYGGGSQHLLAHVDPRLDTITPDGTWADLRYSLAPNNVIKSAYAMVLLALGSQGGQGVPPQLLIDAVFAFLDPSQKRFSRELLDKFKEHSLAGWCDLDEGTGIFDQPHKPASAFIIQGYRDTLFNFNEQLDAALCHEQSGSEMRLLQQNSGHPLPIATPPHYANVNAAMYCDEVVYCNGKKFNTADLIKNWFNEKLLGIPLTESEPEWDWQVCVTQENTDPAIVDEYFNEKEVIAEASPYNGYRWSIEGHVWETAAEVPIGSNGVEDTLFDLIADNLGAPFATGTYGTPLVPVMTLPPGAPSVPVNLGDQGTQQIFVPVRTMGASESTIIAGIPLVQLDITAVTADPVLFVGLGVIRADTSLPDSQPGLGYLDHINQVWTPVRGPLTPANPADPSFSYPYYDDSTGIMYGYERTQRGDYDPADPAAYDPAQPLGAEGRAWGRLSGISVRLNPGDTVGVIFTGSNLQYPYHSTPTPGVATVTGRVQIPFLTSASEAGMPTPKI